MAEPSPRSLAESEIDLDAYLERIGYTGNREPSLSTLHEIHVAHLAAIPFENLDVRLGRTIHLDLDHLQRKLIENRRGGYCFEQNTLFAAALAKLGFEVSTLEARVRPPGATAPLPRTHMTLHVRCDGDPWLADVGFGADGPLEPVRLDGSVSHQPGDSYRIVAEAKEIRVLQRRDEEGWQDLYALSLVPALPVDFSIANYFTSTHPQSIFVRTLTVQRSRPGNRHILRGRIYTVRTDTEESSREISDDEVTRMVRDVFDLAVEDDEVLRALPESPSDRSIR